MTPRLDPSRVASLSLLASLALRDLNEVERGDVNPATLHTGDIRRSRLTTVAKLMEAVARGADPVYAHPGEQGGALLEDLEFRERAETLDRDLEVFLLVSELHGGEPGPAEMKTWAREIEASLAALLVSRWSELPEPHRRTLTEDLEPLLRKLERLDERPGIDTRSFGFVE